MLAANDGEVREFNRRLADVAGFLADERGDLATAVRELSLALDDVARFVKDNRELVKSDVDRLTDVTAVVVEQRKALAEVLDVAPAALGNLSLAYNGASGTLDARADINELTMPVPALVCELLLDRGAPIPEKLKTACDTLAPVLDGVVPLPSAADVITALQSGQPPPVPGLALPTEPAPSGGPQGPLPLPGLPGAPAPEGERAEPSGEATPTPTGRAERESDDDTATPTPSRTSDEDDEKNEDDEERRGGWPGLFGGGR
jgi:hypothetical protein